MEVKIENSWHDLLKEEWDKPYFGQLASWVRDQYASHTVFPPAGKIFAAFDSCPVDDVKVVILGQDPYHDYNQANGLCFSVCDGVPFPPSLMNIFKEVHDDTGAPIPQSGDLQRWASQGVLLLNATLTVEAHKAGSHQGKGWEELTDKAIRLLAEKRQGIVFMLWGSDAIRKGNFIDRGRHCVLTAPHPSPLSAYRGFFGCRHFSRANEYLLSKGKTPIEW